MSRRTNRVGMSRCLVAATLAIAGASTVAQAPASAPAAGTKQAPPAPVIKVNDGGVSFTPVSEHLSDSGQPQLGNGVIANPQLWPASLVARVDGDVCTATLVGPRTLLTAAHCVGDTARISIDFDKGKTSFKGTCRRTPRWSIAEPSNDLALCLMDAPVKHTGLSYERMSLDPAPITTGRQLLAGGYGCQDLNRQKLEDPPVFRTGSVYVDRVPTPGDTWPNWIFTSAATDASKAFICPGDSGGAVYWVRADQSRLIVAVASAVQSDPARTDYKVSYLAALSTTDAFAFIDGWWKQAGHEICGLSPSADGCRPTPM